MRCASIAGFHRTVDQGRRLVVAATMFAAIGASARGGRPPTDYDVIELGRDIDRDTSTGALAVSDLGIAVGWVGDAPAIFSSDGRAERLGDRAGRAIGFDRAGRVVGRFFGSDDGMPPSVFVRHGSVLLEAPPARRADALTDAGRTHPRAALPGAFFAESYGANGHGDVVGTSDTGVGSMQRAVLQRASRVIDLGALPNVGAAGWRRLLVAYAINDRGAVVGVGERDPGVVRGFMLIPRVVSRPR